MVGTEFTDFDGQIWVWNAFGLASIFDFIPMPHCPSAGEADMAFLGWKAGYRSGKRAGRSVLQNEFRNLMDCQPR